MNEGDQVVQRKKWVGALAACVVTVLVLAGCHRSGTSGTAVGLEALARSAPADAQVFMAADWRNKTTMAEQIAKLQKILADSPTLQKQVGDLEARLNVTLQDVSTWTAPAGFLCVLPPAGEGGLAVPGESPDFVLALAVTNPQAAESALLRLQQSFAKARGEGQISSCESNLKKIGTALEMYSTDNAGRYPTSMALLTPNYLKVIPTCPAAGSDTYSSTLQSASNPDAYTFNCAGDHHGEGPTLPAYTSTQGLVTGPILHSPAPVAAASSTPLFTAVPVGTATAWAAPGPEPFAYVVHGGYLLLGNGTAALGRVIQTLDGKSPNLSSVAQFSAARQQAGGDDGALAYASLSKTVSQILTIPEIKDKTDAQTVQGLSALQTIYARLTPGPDGMQSDVFIKVDATSQSAFIKTLLTAPQPDAVLARYFPAKWSNFSTGNVTWIYNTVLETLRLVPSVRGQLAFLPVFTKAQLGLDLEQDVLGATTGWYAASSNWPDTVPQMMGQNFGLARSQGQLSSCESNLKNMGTALEMYSTDNAGHYPPKLSYLMPNYLRLIPTCPSAGTDSYSASYTVASSPDAYTFACQGGHHKDVGVAGDFPAYNSAQGLVVPERTATAQPTPPPLTSLIAVHMKSVETAQALISKIQQKAGAAPHTVQKVGDVAIQSVGDAPVRWALAEKPDVVLFVAYGPQAETWIETALGTPSTPGASVAEQGDYAAMMKQAGSRKLIASDYTDYTPLVGAFTQLLQTAADRGGEGAELVPLLIKQLEGLGSIKGVSYTELLPDSLHIAGRGAGSSTMAMSATAIGAAILVPNFIRARSQGQLTSCESNEKNIGTALEMYSTDNAGRYPPSQRLDLLTPNYLRVIPTCPSANADTYSPTYQSKSNPDAYHFGCNGDNHHVLVAPGFPQYNSEQGLISGH